MQNILASNRAIIIKNNWNLKICLKNSWNIKNCLGWKDRWENSIHWENNRGGKDSVSVKASWVSKNTWNTCNSWDYCGSLAIIWKAYHLWSSYVTLNIKNCVYWETNLSYKGNLSDQIENHIIADLMCHRSTNLHLNNQRSRKNCIPRSINRNSHWTINGKVIEYAKLSQKVT